MNSQENTGRLAGLDGIRALSVAMVILQHAALRYQWPHKGTPLNRWIGTSVGNGALWTVDGVGIFFVLSGFLITTLLLREFSKTSDISLSMFYYRRFFRILPPLMAYLAFVFAFCLLRQIPFHASDFTSTIFFYRDYSNASLWATEHTWSLSVEEQFYLCWPLVLLWLLKKRGRSAAITFALCTIAITPFLRVASSLLHIHALAHKETFMFHCRMDALMAGCLVALCCGQPRFEALYQRVARVWWILPLEFCGVSFVLYKLFGVSYPKTIGFTVDALAVAFFLLWVTRNSQHWIGRILNHPVLVWAGVMSYSAYLWQTFFLHPSNPSLVGRAPWCFVLIWVAAWLSHVLVEKPFFMLRDVLIRRSGPQTTPPPALAQPVSPQAS